jgi:4-amino-4-deoxy-L-arabinose transferase-like glycosyltransferase
LWVRHAVGKPEKGERPEKIGPAFFFYYLLFLLTGIATLINYLLPLVPVAALSTAFIWRCRQEAGVAFAATLMALLGVLNGLTHFEYAGFVLAAVSVVAVIPFLPWRPKLGSVWALLFLMVLVLVSVWKVHAYWCNPPDPNRVWVLAVLAHPARYPGETLLFVGEHTDARVLEFYGDYHVIPIDRLPPKRPHAAILFQEGDKAVFLPALEKSLPAGKKPLQE